MKIMRKLKIFVSIICAFILVASNAVYAFPQNRDSSQNTSEYSANIGKVTGWHSIGSESWFYYNEQGKLKTGWLNDSGNWYYLSTKADGTEGLMKYGWYKDGSGKQYFLNTKHDGTFGKALTAWQWIDGYCYFFGEDCSLYKNTTTPDGYKVNTDGKWIKDSVVQYVDGKGLLSKSISVKQVVTSSGSSHRYTSHGNNGQTKQADANTVQPDKKNSNSKQSDAPKEYTLTFDFNYEDQEKIETVTVKAGDYAQELSVPYRKGYYFLAWYENKNEPDLTNAFSFKDTQITKNTTLYALWIDMEHDNDNDGMMNGEEVLKKNRS